MRFSMFLKSILLLGTAVMAFGFSACGDDVVAPDPNLGKKAPITLLNVNTDLFAPVIFADGTTNISTSVPYGVETVVQTQIGQRTISVKSISGSTTYASTGVQIDTTRPVWVVHTGTASAPAAFAVDAVGGTPSAGKALVRLIHATKDVNGTVSLKIGDKDGATLASNVEKYKASNFTSIDTNQHTLVLTKAATTDTLEVPAIPVNLVAGKLYTVIVYGSPSASADPAVKLTAKIVAEP
jgi:hypothetical protein